MKKIANCIAVLILFCTCLVNAATEQIVNGEFDSGLSPWEVNDWGAGSISGSVDSSGKISGVNSLKLRILSGGVNVWDLNTRQLFNLYQGNYYEISFYAMANTPCQIEMTLNNTNSPYDTFVWRQFSLGTEPVRFTASGTAAINCSGTLEFNLGKLAAGVIVWLDKVSVLREQPPSGQVNINVDFNSPVSVNNMSGFLLGLNPSNLAASAPSQVYMDTLQPAYWRVRPTSSWVDRVELSGATAICLLSEGWYPGDPMTNATTPWSDNYAAWKAYVRSKAQEFGTSVVYDIWNEPDHNMFFMNWPGATFEKFLETFKAAHDVIRQELGTSALISGPSMSESISPVKHRQFMDYCKNNGLTVQILSIHMLDRADSQFGQMVSDIQALRSDYIDNSTYSSVGTQYIHVNEYGGYGLQSYRPGSLLAFLASLELAGVDGACKSCWPHPGCETCSTCWDGSLDGIMTINGVSPRSTWWVYKWYAGSVEGRVSSDSSSYGVFPLASISSDMPDTAQIIIGSNAKWGEPVTQSTVKITLQNIDKIPYIGADLSKIAISVEDIPYSDANVSAAVNSPAISEQFIIDVVDGRAELTVTDLKPYQVKRILLRDPNGMLKMLKGTSQYWLSNCSIPLWCDNYDLNHSSKVDLLDLSYIAHVWLGN